MNRIYGYARISTKKQNIERQIRNILSEFPNAIIYREAYTGTTIHRPCFDQLMRIVRPGDQIIFDSVSRMSRNAEEGYKLYSKLYEEGIDLVFLKERYINTATYRAAIQGQIPLTGTDVDEILKGINTYLMRLAERQIEIAFEQSEKEVTDLRRRTAEGIETARRAGKQIGRISGRTYQTRKSVSCVALIRQHSEAFGGTLSDTQMISLLRGTLSDGKLSRCTFYKYKKMAHEEADREVAEYDSN